ncbi:MAG TPA: hypothetical protein PKY77_24450 [Phycisphaerae bacterium]|nr:hypothetical protein [Phycisphaerae bacterium]HRY70681.1 hypothetical protein [Phycisphaerae bacterium]HSA28724.1 hypothetical protein [Phycisphaerae bacterium]
MSDFRSTLVTLLLVVQCVGITINILLTAGLHPTEPAERPLACAAIPWAYITEYPECADRLLKAMNITHVEIRRFNGTLPGDEIYENPIIKAWQQARANTTGHPHAGLPGGADWSDGPHSSLNRGSVR